MFELTRRRFFQALAASVLAAGVPLPVGFPVLANADQSDPVNCSLHQSSNGDCHIVYQTPSDHIFYAVSKDGGLTWSDEKPL